MASRLVILQHNVLHWSRERRNELNNNYRDSDPDVILINSHGQKDCEKVKLFGYKVYQSNKSGEMNDGIAIAVKGNIKHKIIDDFEEEFMATEIDTPTGPIIVATAYLPPRRPLPPHPDLIRLARYHKPVYLLGDLNARHQTFGNRTGSNPVGHALARLMREGKYHHLGPHFPTLIRRNCATNPDLVLTNRRAFLNHHLREGEISTSDHLPVIMTLSTNPIQIPSVPLFLMHLLLRDNSQIYSKRPIST